MNPPDISLPTDEFSKLLKFIDSIHKLRKAREDLSLDPESERLLEAITIAYNARKPYTVTQLMKLVHIGSTATLHRRMIYLIKLKLINQEFLGPTKRFKHLIPSELAIIYFQEMNSIYLKSINMEL
jgi:hypothetical protein